MQNDNQKEIVVIYHGNCIDGFAGAYMAWKKFKEDAIYIGTENRQNPPDDLLNKQVYIIDYSYPKDILLAIKNNNKSLTIIDHHVSAQNDVESIPGSIFNNDHSGAYLSAQHFFPDEKISNLVSYIEDGDLYKFNLPNSKSILSYLHNQDLNFDTFAVLENDLETQDGLNKIIDYGNVLLADHNREVEYFANHAEKVIFEGYEIYISNATKKVASDLGHILADRTSLFSLIYYYDQGRMKCSLRSTGKIDVSLIAKKYGGGGHHNASGFAVVMDNPLPFITKISGINQ